MKNGSFSKATSGVVIVQITYKSQRSHNVQQSSQGTKKTFLCVSDFCRCTICIQLTKMYFLQIKELLVFQVMVAQKWLMKNELLLVTLLCSLLSLPFGHCLGSNSNEGGQRLRRSPSVANFGKRITSSLVAELGKRPKDMYAFGIGELLQSSAFYLGCDLYAKVSWMYSWQRLVILCR